MKRLLSIALLGAIVTASLFLGSLAISNGNNVAEISNTQVMVAGDEDDGGYRG